MTACGRTRGVQTSGKAEAGELRNVGDPVALALRYNDQGADEMVFFDITASAHGRKTMVDVIERAADQCFMPLTVGGGIKSVEDMGTRCFACRSRQAISINSPALANPDLISRRLRREIRQPMHRGIHRSPKNRPGQVGCLSSHGGRKDTGLDAIEWAKKPSHSVPAKSF